MRFARAGDPGRFCWLGKEEQEGPRALRLPGRTGEFNQL
eukprot:gene6121-2727_t